jgi:hypothetical protein
MENKDNKNGWGGKRPGSGSYVGRKNKSTIEKEALANEIKKRVIKAKDVLLNSQISLAQGCQYLYKIKKNKKGDKQNRRPELVTNQNEIADYLAGEYECDEDEYYYMTTERPDNKALDSLIDRVAGKPTQGVELSGQVNINSVLDDLE